MPSSSQSTSRIRHNPISSRNSRRALRAARSVLPASASLSDLETAINTGTPPQDVEDALADVLHDALTQLHRVRQHEMKLRAFAECGDIVRTYLHIFQLLIRDSRQFSGEGLVEFYEQWVNPKNHQGPRAKFVR